jgi:hypothetical protein
MFLPEALRVLQDCELVPVAPRGKRPIADGWELGLSRAALSAIAQERPKANVGMLARHRPAVDIDITDEPCALAVQLAAELELGFAPVRIGHAPKRLLMYRTDTPFRKVKAFLRAPDGSTKNLAGKDWAVEVLGDGQFYVVEGIHPDTGGEFTWNVDRWWEQALPELDEHRARAFLDVLPAYLPQGWDVIKVTGSAQPALILDDDDDRALLALAQQPLDGWDEDRVILDIAPYIDLECHYDDWVKVGQALHHQFEGSDEGFDLWDKMFEESSKYKGPAYGRERWDSFGGYSGRRVTLATLIHETKAPRDAARVASSAATVAQLRARVEAATELATLEVEISRDARGVKMLEVDRESLAVAIRVRVRELGGAIGIGAVRGWLRPARVSRDIEMAAADAPEWAREWVFCANGDKFFSLRNKQLVTAFGFRALYNRHMPVDEDSGERARADTACLESWNMPVVDNLAYVPWAGQVFDMNGCRWANLYREDLVPEIGDAGDAAGLAAVGLMVDHARRMFPDDRERGIFLSWCAWQVQSPGVKVRWAPYLFGVEGDGKSFWAGMVGAAMGMVNVRSVTAKVLESPFTDWANGAALIVLEEMKQHGHNRFDVMNALKPLITNDIAEIHPKGRAPYMAPNTANYLLLSNYMDGAPVTDGDRRYMFLHSAIELDAARSMSSSGYFNRLFGALQAHPGAIRRWLLGYSLHPEFVVDGRAPDTQVRSIVLEAVKPELDSLVEDVIEDEFFGDTLVFSELVTALKLAGATLVSEKNVGASLGRLGYGFMGRQRRDGVRCRVWSRKKLSTQEISEFLSHQKGAVPLVAL